MGYLTPETLPTGTTCRVLIMPDDEQIIANITGALEVLLSPEAWTPYGAVTPENAANSLVDMFDLFCDGADDCGV